MNRCPDTFQTVTDRSLFGQNVPHGMDTLTRWFTNSSCIAQARSSSTHSSTVRQTITSAVSQQLQSDLSAAGTTDPTQHRLPLPKLDTLAVDADEGQPEKWEAEDDVKGGPLDNTVCVGHGGARVLHRSRGTGANRTQPNWPQVARYQQKVAPKPHVTARAWCVRKCATKGSNRSSRQHLRWKLCESYSVLRLRKTFFELKTLF